MTVLYNARGENPTHFASLRLLQKIAPKLGVTIIEKPIKIVSELEKAISGISRETTDGLFSICATIFRDLTKHMAETASQKKVALSGCSPLVVTGLWGSVVLRCGQLSTGTSSRLVRRSDSQRGQTARSANRDAQ